MFEGVFPSQEQIDAHEREHEQRKMRWEAFSNDFTAMVTEEISVEHLKVLSGILSLIGNNQNPCALANFYEGITAGALATRTRRCGEGGDEELTTLLNGADPRGQ